MGGGSPKQSGTQTQKVEPWDKQQPYLETGFQNIANMFTTEAGEEGPLGNTLNLSALTPDYYSGSTVVAPSAETQLAQNLQLQRGLQGNEAVNAGMGQVASTARGDYLNSNPYLDRAFNQAADAVRNQVSSQFSGAGRYGSGLHKGTAEKAYNDLATQIYGGNYAQERNRQLTAAGLAPSYGKQDYIDLQAIADVGAQKESTAKDYLQEAMDRYYYQANQPLQAMQTYMDLIQGNYGSTSSQPIYSNRGAGRMGGALSGAAAGAQLGSIFPGIGTGIGAIGGGLMGGLFG